MKNLSRVRFIYLVLLLPVLALTGCPPEVGVEIQFTPESLDYGRTAESRVLRVYKNYTSNAMAPFVLTTDQDWITPATCLDLSDRCISNGRLNKVRIPVRIDRSKLDLGLNVGKIYIASAGVATVTVPVVAEEIAKADFVADRTSVSFGRPVTFQDLSLATQRAGTIRSWRWDFGDGSTSAQQNPTHVFTKTGLFSVSLTIETTRGIRRTAVKTAYVSVEDLSGKVNFSASSTNVVVGESITFSDLSTLENTPILSRTWSFGDGVTRSEASPTYAYSSSGIYSVSLTLETSAGNFTATKENYIIVRGAGALRADFAFQNAYVEEEAQFFPTVSGQTGAVQYRWDFGDGTVTVGQTPTHRYANKGEYDVELRVSDSKTAVIVRKTIRVRYRPPQTLFSAFPTRQAVGRPIQFTDKSVEGYGSIVAWKWSFGDGNTSTQQNPQHTYERLGKFTVTLEVTSNDPDNQRSTQSRKSYIEILEEGSIIDGEQLDLDRYVAFDDGCFSYSSPIAQPVIVQGQFLATAYIVNRMVSQCWNPDNAVVDEYVRWTHPVTIIDPFFKVSNTAMVFVDGGSRTSTAGLDEVMAQVAILSGTTIVHIKNVPSQPIVFTDEVIPPFEEDNYFAQPNVLRRRTEDAIIAYSYDKYLESYRETGGDPTYEWPALFPMAKSAVKAMDMAEQILASNGVQVDGFIVSGASKRGWTTWLTGATDRRVRAIAPIVINVLNMPPHLEHHRASYGYWSPAIYDYAQKGIFDQLIGGLTDEARALLERVDPYQYALRGRYPMPKFMMNATGDEFFVPDTTQFYFDGLQPDKHLCYIPNVGHGMGGLDEDDLTNPSSPVGMLLAWYMAVSQNRPLPEFSQTFEPDGAIRVQIDPTYPPISVRLWQATSPGLRDFRNHILGAQWTSTLLTPQTPGVYRARPDEPADGDYLGFFIQLEYTNPAQLPPPAQAVGFRKPNFVFTTGVRVLPVRVGGAPVYPEFVGYNANELRPDAVYFDEDVLPVITLYGSPFQMGRDYGELLADSINGFVPEFIDLFQSATGTDDAHLMNVWNDLSSTLDNRVVQEIVGIASAPNVQVSLSMLQMAHAAAIYSGDLWSASATVAHGNLLTDADAGHAVSLNSEFGLNLADYLCALVYIPDQGAPHTVFTYAGLAFGYTGINLGGISTSEVPNPTAPAVGANALPLMRTILYDAFSLRDAIALASANPPRNTSLVFGDARNESRAVRIRTDANGIVPPLRYDLAQSDFSRMVPGIVYDTAPDQRLLLRTALNSAISNLRMTDLLYVANLPPFATPAKNVLNVTYEGMPLNIFINVAQGVLEAYRTLPTAFNMQMLLP